MYIYIEREREIDRNNSVLNLSTCDSMSNNFIEKMSKLSSTV